MTSQRTRERMITRLREQHIGDQRVLEVMRATPRHMFVDEALAQRAYEDSSLPIGYSQTLSQPYIVARMSELLLAAGPLHSVLEIGTGSGYQTAVLAQLVERVYSVERIKPLQLRARQLLRSLRHRNIQFRHSDGGMGWDTHGPYDGIISTAAPETIPEELLMQLAPGGRLVIPVGGDIQHLQLVVRTDSGFDTEIVDQVRFVPLLGGVVK
ncbi:protein-L-isoaspartate(D-aspartate) O-methyltransferase [Halieaceae bacterium IMCC14734]|uniref:Protein-L-isoaspartate O-methyltransferase n=1 Tax=Candidatus Litorirhabdus singularis TaxID=2518993 RepID=A0ABT3TIM3_9GAMM|nr:protein-L-isoaspartate(D-aspartate) O-methyltransferase [Candidatus Litorirhabdus singularis]MCX2982131.1 protein-L-isoaspartate(D-aspartate) O-methyltransferase [Candidatus Litorirhabdus singularis]